MSDVRMVAAVILTFASLNFSAASAFGAQAARLPAVPCAAGISIPFTSFCVVAPTWLSALFGADRTSEPDARLAAKVRMERATVDRGVLQFGTQTAPKDRVLLVAAFQDGMEQVETDFDRRFTQVPAAYVFATVEDFTAGLQALFLYSASDALPLARQGGVLERKSVVMAINWRLVSGERPVTIVIHELTHAMVFQIVGDNELPAWLEEGLAMLEQQELPVPDDRLAISEYYAVALLSSGRVSLARLVTAEEWLRATERTYQRTYDVASVVTHSLRDDLGRSGLIDFLEQVGRGVPFEDAFAEAVPVGLDQFEREIRETLAARTRLSIAIDSRPRSDGNVLWRVMGAPGRSGLRVEIDGLDYHVAFLATADDYGMYIAAFGSTAPPGRYTITVTGDASTARAEFEVP